MKRLERMPPKAGGWEITKEQVIASELSRAIRLFIVDQDMVSAHLLTGAARDIIHARAKALGKPRLWDTFKDSIKEEAHGAFIGMMKDEYNFFKHADRDGEEVNRYYKPEITEFFLWETITDFELLTGVRYLESALYILWFFSRHPDIIKEEYRHQYDGMRELWREDYDAEGRLSRASVAKHLKILDEVVGTVEFPLPVLALAGAKPPAKPGTDTQRGNEKG